MQSRTTLVAAHRLSTLRNATRILVLERGRVSSLGTHDELMRHCPLYRRMWNGQRVDHEAPPQPVGIAAATVLAVER
jgi:ABC-type multidrug transport system fused ATPase/permease subunit